MPPASNTWRIAWELSTRRFGVHRAGRGAVDGSVVAPFQVQANLGKLADQARGPAIDVMLLDLRPHALHARFLFFRAHLQRGAYRVSQLIGVIRVDH